MNDQWLNIYAMSGWDLKKVNGTAAPYPEPLNTHLAQMISMSESEQFPFAVPRVDVSKQLHFYLIANEEQQSEELFSTVKAYLGSSYSTCNPLTIRSSEDDFEKVLLELYPQGFKRISIYKACSSQENKDPVYWVMSSLSRALKQYQQRPISTLFVKRPIGVILRHFFIAVQNQQGRDALQLLDELKNHQRLSPRNILSLEIQALAAGGQWQQILRHSKIDDLLKGTIPRRLQNVLLESVGFEKNNTTDPVHYDKNQLSRELQSLSPIFSSLPDLESDSSSIEKWKLWAIGAVSLGWTVAIDRLPKIIDSNWIDDLKIWAGISTDKNILLKEKIPSIEEFLIADSSIQNASELLIESIQANFKDCQKIYLRLVEYPPEIMESICKDNIKLKGLWEILKEVSGDQVEVNNWHQLFQLLGNVCKEEEANKALTISEERSEYWTGDDWQENSVMSEIERISEDTAQRTLRAILPILLAWLRKKEKKLSSEVIDHLVVLLVSDNQIAAVDLLLIADLLLMLVNQSHTKNQYQSIIDCIDDCWSKVRSPKSVDSIFDIYEILIDYPCADESKRIQSWISTQTNLIDLWLRLDKQQKQLCFDIALSITNDISAFPQLEIEDDDAEHEFSEDLVGKRLAIYTLTEGAGRRAKKLLLEYYPGLEIHLNNDKSATNALINLAESADFFIFSSRSAAHQAFYPVSQRRHDLIYPAGKGSSSIVRSFKEALESS